jgi:acetylornithine deacetylase/succinyl-diaminopimelate desuccinylase-like protein
VIPSEAKATFDVRLHPDEDQSKFLDQIRAVIGDPTIDVRWARDRYRPAGASRLDTELYASLESEMKQQYGVELFPTMSTGASDKAQIRSRGVQCYGVGPAIDIEDGAKGFGAHSDQERVIEAELHKFVRFQYDLVMDVARAR